MTDKKCQRACAIIPTRCRCSTHSVQTRCAGIYCRHRYCAEPTSRLPKPAFATLCARPSCRCGTRGISCRCMPTLAVCVAPSTPQAPTCLTATSWPRRAQWSTLRRRPLNATTCLMPAPRCASSWTCSPTGTSAAVVIVFGKPNRPPSTPCTACLPSCVGWRHH